jgi:hypothetical protein
MTDKPYQSPLAKFFREATEEERKKVFTEVARKATEKQNEYVKQVEKDIPDSVKQAFISNPEIKKVVTSEGVYWRGLKAFMEDPDRDKDPRPQMTMDIQGRKVHLSPQTPYPYERE